MFFKIGVVKNFANLTGKHLCWSQENTCVGEIFENTFFCRTPPVTSSALRPLKLQPFYLVYLFNRCALFRKYVGAPQLVFTWLKPTLQTLELCEICSKLTIKTLEWRQWRRSSVFIIIFKQISHIFWMFQTLNKQIPAYLIEKSPHEIRFS